MRSENKSKGHMVVNSADYQQLIHKLSGTTVDLSLTAGSSSELSPFI